MIRAHGMTPQCVLRENKLFVKSDFTWFLECFYRYRKTGVKVGIMPSHHTFPRRRYRKDPTAPPGYKRCPVCRQTLPVADFHKSSSARDGLQSYCRWCNISRVKAWYKRNRARCIEVQLAYQRRVKALSSPANESQEGTCEVLSHQIV